MHGTMDRKALMTRFAARDQLGLEIAPWVNPLVPKAEGYRSRTLDIFDRTRLVANAVEYGLGNLVDRIEEVDFVCDAAEIGSVASGGTRFSYIVSSHNFEHLPNPVKFLRGCGAVLEEGGHLSMAIPDKRCCFDYFRPVSITAGMLAAYFENRVRPTPAQIFEHVALGAGFYKDGKHSYGFPLTDDLSGLLPGQRLDSAFATWKQALIEPDQAYTDAHCWTFTPASFELIMGDLRQLELIDLAVVEVVWSPAGEFFAHLRRETGNRPSTAEFYARRTSLLHQMMRDCAANVASGPEVTAPPG